MFLITNKHLRTLFLAQGDVLHHTLMGMGLEWERKGKYGRATRTSTCTLDTCGPCCVSNANGSPVASREPFANAVNCATKASCGEKLITVVDENATRDLVALRKARLAPGRAQRVQQCE